MPVRSPCALPLARPKDATTNPHHRLSTSRPTTDDALARAERLGRYLDTIEATASRLASLTEDLLDVSQLQRGQLRLRPRLTDLAALVTTAVARQQIHTERHDIELSIQTTLPDLLLDPDRVQQILTNLLDNSVKYTPDGGRIRVTLAGSPVGALLTVQDTGIGLPSRAVERIFQPFGRADNATAQNLPGLGLGLYICRRIAEQHGGRLWAESDGEGRGATFSLWLPSVPSPASGDGVFGCNGAVSTQPGAPSATANLPAPGSATLLTAGPPDG